MAEIQDDKERKKLYGLLVSDPATRKNTAQYSFKQWENIGFINTFIFYPTKN
jgi:hypothetical protein